MSSRHIRIADVISKITSNGQKSEAQRTVVWIITETVQAREESKYMVSRDTYSLGGAMLSELLELPVQPDTYTI